MKAHLFSAAFALAAIAFSPVALSAQNAVTGPRAVSAVLYAESEMPALLSESRSILNDSEPYAGSARTTSSAASVAKAESGSARPFSAVGIGVKVGLGGIGFDVATPLVKRLNVRGGAGFFSYTYNGTIDSEAVNATLKLNNAEAMLDLFPFNGSFRLSAGATVYDDTGLSGTIVEPGGSKFTVGNTLYTSSTNNPVNGTVSATFGSKVVPRFTLGWGNMVPRSGHVRFETEFGVEVIGTPPVGWTYTGNACVNGPSACTTTTGSVAASDIAVQNANLQSDLNGLRVFPIISFGLSYKIGSSH